MYFELKHHGPHLKRIIDDQLAQLGEAQQKLLKVEEKQPTLEERIHHANQMHSFLEERLQSLRNLPGAHKKPLSRAEREFKSELGTFSFLHIIIIIIVLRIFKNTCKLLAFLIGFMKLIYITYNSVICSHGYFE